MNEKKKCPNCGLLIDSDMDKCPYCGYFIKNDNNKPAESKMIVKNKVEEKPKVKFDKSVIKFNEPRDVSIIKEIILFLLNLFGLTFLSLLVAYIVKLVNPELLKTANGDGIINFLAYVLLFGTFMLILIKDYKKVFGNFKKNRTYLYGIGFGFLNILITAVYSYIVTYFYPGFGSNDNENNLVEIIKIYPIISIVIFGIIGPMCEEIGYRLGLFSLVRKWNRPMAYVITAVVFGFIHFDFTNANLTLEFLNLPAYILAGLLFSYVYDKEGIETSMTAHITNNLFSIIMTILSGVLANGK